MKISSRLECPILPFILKRELVVTASKKVCLKSLVTGICHFHRLLQFGKITGGRLSQIYKGRELSDVNLSNIYSIWLTLANRINIFQNKDSRILSFCLETTLKYYGIYYKLSNTLAWFAHCLRKKFIFLSFYGGFPHSSVGNESACNAGDPGSIPEARRSPGEGIGYPLQYSWASFVAQL